LLHEKVTAEDVAKVVSRETGIPLSKMMLGDKEKLLHMDETLKKEVVGQDVCALYNVHSLALSLPLLFSLSRSRSLHVN
jgi:ATP-dependent Clp protease ATP-binding subunit ClpA